MRSIIVLSLVAASSWAGAWWNDHRRARAERMMAAGVERTDVADRPNRLARELPASDAEPEGIAP